MRAWTIDAATIGDHFDIEGHAAVHVMSVDRRQDPIERLHPHQFPRLKIEGVSGLWWPGCKEPGRLG